MTHSCPKVTYSYPRVTYSDPKVTHSDLTAVVGDQAQASSVTLDTGDVVTARPGGEALGYLWAGDGYSGGGGCVPGGTLSPGSGGSDGADGQD